ncbi:ankyrin repeat domain-containing protein [Legionella jordanis]|uniref:Ankyrin repeats (3 copies) n=1 Tax=Legionella jordanis TaxID=456 RepID=A0A0W0V9N7_9GAMM|nr:ankyrin repeat domain-containing protein [Legionella jordanis]KTD16345.1 Ankyrin repeats (3 copies) [Legionella jordanis]VEH12197.1 Ankyrin repeats (3 copies) [Legionella jordanis]
MGVFLDVYHKTGKNIQQFQTALAANRINIQDLIHTESAESDLFLACDFEYLDLMQFLLEHGVNANAQRSNGQTALNKAVERRRLDIIDLLLAHGADVSIEDKNHLTAIDHAKKGRDKTYYHDQFPYAKQLKQYSWLIDDYQHLQTIIQRLQAHAKPSTPPAHLKDFKTLVQEGIQIANMSELSTSALERLAIELQYSYRHTATTEPINLHLHSNMSPVELIQTVFKDYPGVILGENHEAKSSKRFIIEHLDEIAAQGVSVIFFEHILVEECSQILDEYLNSNNNEPIPEPLKTKLELQDFHRNLAESPYNFTSLVTAIKQFNLANPDKKFRMVLFDTEQSYKIKSENPSNTTRQLVMNYVAHVAIEKEKLRHEQLNTGRPFKYLAFVGETHCNTYHQAVGLANYQQVPGIVLSQLDETSYPSRAPLVVPDYRYWMYSTKEVEDSVNLGAKINYSCIKNLLQYIDRIAPLLAEDEKLRVSLEGIQVKAMKLKIKCDNLDFGAYQTLMQQLVNISPGELKAEYTHNLELSNRLNNIMQKGLCRSEEEKQEALKWMWFLNRNPLRTKDNANEFKQLIKMIEQFELRESLRNEQQQVLFLIHLIEQEMIQCIEQPGYALSTLYQTQQNLLSQELLKHANALAMQTVPEGESSIAVDIKNYYQQINSMIKSSTQRIKPLTSVPQPKTFPVRVWASAIVEDFHRILASEKQLNELDIEMADQAHARFLFPLYHVDAGKRREVLAAAVQMILQRYPEKQKEYLHYFHWQLSKQQQGNAEQIKQDINFLIACAKQSSIEIKPEQLTDEWQYIFANTGARPMELFSLIVEADVHRERSPKQYLEVYATLEQDYLRLAGESNASFAKQQIFGRIQELLGIAVKNSQNSTNTNQSNVTIGFFGQNLQAAQIQRQCLLVRSFLSQHYNELALAFPQLNWPFIDNTNVRLVNLSISLQDNQWLLHLSMQVLKPVANSNNNNAQAFVDETVSFFIPPAMITAVLNLQKPEAIMNAMFNAPIGAIYLAQDADNNNMVLYIKHAQGIANYSFAVMANQQLIDQAHQQSYESLNHFLSLARNFYQLPGLFQISTVQLFSNSVATDFVQSSSHRPG